MKPLLEARQICKQFSGVAVLKGIDFTLGAGQVHALMGGNGAGKSTLMKIIAGVETPDSGELTIGERAFARLNPALAHQLGIYLVPQEPMLFPNLSVRENILFRLPKRADTVARLQDKLQQLNCQINLDASASTAARSAAGSSTLSPPMTFKNASQLDTLSAPRFSSTAINMAARL